MSRTCFELGVCQARKPRCVDCEEPRLLLAPGVIEGPYRRTSNLVSRMPQIWPPKASAALSNLAAWLMGPHP